MFKNNGKRLFAGFLSAVMLFTTSGLSSIGPVFAEDVPDDYPVQFGLTWDDTTVDDTTEIDGSTMTLTPYSDGTEDTTGGTTAKLVLDYTLGSYEAEDGTMVPLTAEAGDIEIRLPAYIFQDRSGNAVGKHYLGIGLQKDSDTGFYYTVDTKNTDTLNDDEIVIRNFATITGDQTFRCNITYWSGQAHAVKDGYEETFRASTTLRDGSVIQYQKGSNELTVKYRTSTEIEKISPVSGNMTYPKLYKNWKSSWGTKPSGLTDYSSDKDNGYIYIAWPVTTVLSQWPTQPGTLNAMTCEVSTDGNTTSDVVAITVKGKTFSKTDSLPVKNEYLDDYQTGYIVTAHKVSELEASGKDTVEITADIKTSFTGVDGCTSGAGILQTYNYDSLTRSGNGSTFTPYSYGPSPEYDDESDGFISLLEISDFGEVLPLKSMMQPNKNTENSWDFVMMGEASNVDELTAGYVTEDTAVQSETGTKDAADSKVSETPAETPTGTDASADTYANDDASKEETKTDETTQAGTSEEAESTSLIDEALDIQNVDAEEGTKTYGVNHYTMEIVSDLFILEGEDLEAGDYQFDNIPYIKIQGIKASADPDEPDMSLNSMTGELTVDSAEVLTWKPGSAAIEGLTLYYKVGNGNWTEYDYVTNKGELAGAGIDGVTAIKAEYQSYYGYAAVQVFTNIDMIKTEHVMDIIGDKSSVTLWNIDSMRSYDAEGHLLTTQAANNYGGTLKDHLIARDEAFKDEDAAAAITESMKQGIENGTLIQQHDFDNIELTVAYRESKAENKVSYTNNTSAGRVEADYTLEVYLEGKSAYKSVLNTIVTRQNEDTFYDLLPKGMSYKKGSATANLIGQTSAYADVSVEQISNWRDTGRTMLIFHVSTKEGQSNYNNYRSGYTLKFTAYYPWEEIQEYGRTPRNSFAYKSGEGNFEGYADDGGRIKEGAYFTDLDGIESDVKDTVYADVNQSLIWNTASVNGFSKRVKAGDDEGYLSDTTVYEGQDYSYRLRYGSETSTTSEGIILYDVLENNYGTNAYWKGTLKSINTSSAEDKGIQPVIYYSTKKGIEITNEEAPDLSDTSVWSRTAPKDLSKVTAIAVDLSTSQDGTPYVLEENMAVSVIVNMTAPNDGVAYEMNGALAYNTSWIKATTKNTASTTETTAVTQSDATTVAIKAPSVIVEKINDGGPEEDEFELTIHVTGASANTEYPVTYTEDGERTDVLKTDANGNGSYTGTVKGGESYRVKLPYGAKYKVSEDPGSMYKASYFISGEGADVADASGLASYGEVLTTEEETVDETADVTVEFTNDNAMRKVVIWKQIYGRYENRSDHKFNFRLDVTGKAGDKYKVILPDGTEDTIDLGLDGKASYDFELKGSEVKTGAEMLAVELPIGATYQVTELAHETYGSDYDPEFYISPNGIFVKKAGTGEPGKDLSMAVETADEKDDRTVTIKFTNTGLPADLHIEKEVTGTGADKEDVFEYVIHFTGLNPGETYDLSGYQYTDGPEETPEGVTMFLSGQEFNAIIKRFNNSSASYSSSDSYVTAFLHSEEAPEEDLTTVVVSTDDSAHEILAWSDNGTVYWYSEAEDVFLNYNASHMFYNFRTLADISGLKNINTSYTTDISRLFYYCQKLTDISALANWDVNSVMNMDYMFCYCGSLTNINALTNWDVSSVTSMGSMFRNCTSISSIAGLANWDVGNVTDIDDIFGYCTLLTDLTPLTNWDVSSVTSMKYTFERCRSLTNLSGLENWNVGNVREMFSTFGACSSLIDISAIEDWDVSSVDATIGTIGMFHSTKITNVDALACWDVRNVRDMSQMFENCTSLTDISGLANWDVSSVKCMDNMFYNTKITNVDVLASWNVSNVGYMDGMFNVCASLTDISGLANWDVSNVINMYGMFANNPSLTDISPLISWNMRSATDIGRMFKNDTSITDASVLSAWNINLDATGVTHGDNGAFNGCYLLEEHPSKYPAWYSSYRGSTATTDAGTAKASLLSLDDTDFVSAFLLSNTPESGESRDVVFDKDDYSTVSAARYNADSGRFIADENGEAYYVFHLKHGAYVDINDLNPEVQYEITEVGNSYIPSYSVTEGSEYTTSDNGKNESPKSDLSTGVETLSAGSSVSYLFTNKKDAGHNITIEKKIEGLANATDLFHYTADLTGLEAGKEYKVKKSTVPVDETEGTFDFSKYRPVTLDLTEELINELTRYTYDPFKGIEGYESFEGIMEYAFDKDGEGLGVTLFYSGVDYGSYNGCDKLSIYADGDIYCASFINSKTGKGCEVPMFDESQISSFLLTNVNGESKTLDLSTYRQAGYVKISEEDFQILNNAVFSKVYSNGNTYVYEFAAADGKLQITETYTYTKNGQKLEKIEVYTGDSFCADSYGGLSLCDSVEGTSESLNISSKTAASYSKKASVETTTFTADDDGKATLTWDMKANDTYQIFGIPEGATYQVKEDGSEKYIASYVITDNNDVDGILDTVVKTKDANLLRNQDLSTAKETVDLYEDVVITFTNTAPMPVLPMTGGNTALLITLIGLFGVAGYGIYEVLRRRKCSR